MARSLAYEPRYALNAICPYFTMFPLEYPLRVLKKHKKDRVVVMDPFCGRGTTLFAARTLGLAARGIDASPVAVAIAKAKLCQSGSEAVLNLAKEYVENIVPAEIPESEFFQRAFHGNVLTKICAIREGLLNAEEESDELVLLRATMLGCLHGPMTKNLDAQSYFSNQMPRTFASKPDYSVRYWKKNKISAPAADVLGVLRRKLSRIELVEPPEGVSPASVLLGDSRLESSFNSSNLDFSVVVTSPPYYGMRTYVEDQWLRNWFLGGPDYVQYGNSVQLEHAGTDTFAKSLGMVWANMAKSNSNELDMYIRFGIIPSAKVDAISLMRASLEESGVAWRVVSTRAAATASSGKRQAELMSTSSKAAVEYDFHVSRI
uniref:DNA methyltransferase n=1 Tax=Pandoraea pnomenusa TaxID=93220 RepID=UPI0009B918B8|nr:DNA methyltransferase [Pandoraea pnomenusa]